MNCNNKVKKPNKEIAKKALEEANERNFQKKYSEYPVEINGPSTLEPTRYGDWERKGIISDF